MQVSPYQDSSNYALHTIENKKNEEVCATDATVTMGADTSICMYEADSISVNVNLGLTPNPAKATVQTIWQMVYPDSSTDDNSKYYSSFDVTGDTTFTLTGYWPGVTSVDSVVELYFQVNVFDCNLDTLVKQTRTFHWDETVCDPPAPEEADLSIEKTVNDENPENGDNVTYTITVTNNGPKDAPNVVVSELLPDGLDYGSATPSQGAYNSTTGLWNVGTLGNGASATLQVNATVNIDSLTTSAVDLGVASDYNVFVLKDVKQPSSDTEGKMAVGRNAELANYSVGDKLTSFGEDVLIVDGNLTYTSGRVYNGNVVYGNSTNLPIDLASVDGDVLQGHPIDFDAAGSYLRNLSVQLSNYSVNGFDTLLWSELTLTGNDPYLNVFKVDGEDLTNATNFRLDVPEGSVVLVNVDGTDMNWTGGLDIGNADKGNVLYNFYNASKITISNIDVQGTILAPFAEVNFISGQHNGQMIAKFIYGAGQFNNSKFIGNLPADTSITNVAEVYNSGIDDPDSTPNNGDTSEDDYDYAVVRIGQVDNTSVTDDEGTQLTWESVGTFGINEIIYVLTNDMNGNILAGTWGGNIYRSVDSGLNWEEINESMTVGFIWSIVVDSSNTIYVGTEQGVYYSNDEGANWVHTSLDDKDVRALGIDPNGNLYAGTWGLGVYKSTDGGATWTEANSGLDSKAVSALVVDSNSDIYVGTFGGGVYRSVDDGESWSQLDVGYPYIWSLGVTSYK